eukprot:2918466-Rhodomonas_salina.1
MQNRLCHEPCHPPSALQCAMSGAEIGPALLDDDGADEYIFMQAESSWCTRYLNTYPRPSSAPVSLKKPQPTSCFNPIKSLSSTPLLGLVSNAKALGFISPKPEATFHFVSSSRACSSREDESDRRHPLQWNEGCNLARVPVRATTALIVEVFQEGPASLAWTQVRFHA